MVSNPTIGQRVRVWYRVTPQRRGMVAAASVMPHHGKVGTVRIRGRGRPRNHGIELGGEVVIVPAGNLQPINTEPRDATD